LTHLGRAYSSAGPERQRLPSTGWPSRASGGRHTFLGPTAGLAYGVSFAAAYALLVVPQAWQAGTLVEAFEGASVFGVVAVLSDVFVRADRRARKLHQVLTVPPFGAEQLAIREGLLGALRKMDIGVDVELAPGQLGLTAVQAELLAYLLMGLTDFEVSDAAGVSEATVRYRLTRLYRALGVRGRRDATRRARERGSMPTSGAHPSPTLKTGRWHRR
jgi:DNA-binding CsgD family transcriptional regulator